MKREHKEMMKARARNIALRVAYDGTAYAGFQRQTPPVIAVQNVLEEKLARILGTHDFSAFRAAGGAPMSPVRTMYEATLEEERPGLLACRIHGSGFLYHMVRNLMGTIANVGLGVLQPADIDRILASRDRAQASATAPAHGLYLLHVAYGEEAPAHPQKNIEKTVDR